MNNLLVVQSNPVVGREVEYNDWYSNRHLRDVLSVPGFVAAQRFALSDIKRLPDTPDYGYRYLALYEFEGSPRSAFDRLTERTSGSNPVIFVSPALADRTAYAFTPITARLER